MKVQRVQLAQLKLIIPLFDGYIRFYRGKSDFPEFEKFLSARLKRNEAVIFAVFDEDGVAMGFTLLYPSFSSVSMARIFVLNDLYVDELHRKKGVARRLLDKAVEFGRLNGAVRLHLETEENNETAQRLYKSHGWVKEKGYFHYHISL